MDKIEQATKEILKELNMKIHVRGYLYWIEAIEYVISNNLKIYSMTKEIYKEIAKKYSTTVSRTERALRHATEEIKENIKKYFNIDYEITNKGFLALVVDKVKEKLNCTEAN